MKKLNIIFGIILIAVAAFFFYYANTFSTISGQKDFGPSAFPQFICILLIACGILLIIREIKKNSNEKVSLFNLKFIIGLLFIFLYFLSLKTVGFLINSMVISAVMMLLLLNEPLKKAWPLIIGVSLIVPFVLYMIFGVFLNVPIPMGILAGIF